jgi:hypothetical protein
MDIYKCPKSIFENTLGNRKLPVLYILTIFLLKEPPFHEVMKGCAKGVNEKRFKPMKISNGTLSASVWKLIGHNP